MSVYGTFLWCKYHTKKIQKSVCWLINTYFDSLFRNINLKRFDVLFEELDFETINDINALKIALFYFTDITLMEENVIIKLISHCLIK